MGMFVRVAMPVALVMVMMIPIVMVSIMVIVGGVRA